MPFDLGGPAFLLFFVVTCAVVVVVTRVLQELIEHGPVPRIGEPDPYQIAYLRAGAAEAMRVATLALVDRQLLVAEGELLKTQTAASERVRRPLERAVLSAFAAPSTPTSVFTDDGALAACDELARGLRGYGMLPTPGQLALRAALGGVAAGLLWLLAGMKISIALERGRHNVGFLVVLAVLVPVPLFFALRSRWTPAGRRVLQDLQLLFRRLRERSPEVLSGGATNELALLAGVYGLDALSGTARDASLRLFPKRTGANDSSSMSSCGSAASSSSCSSSSGSSCGSSCGGGGGCGGCGS